ncbi:MAG: dockerin type I domain-containing protein, partial [Rubripirellula sp.]|nr:dockerin type I domain-containing protein [Rubripirellula sp.]
AGSSYDVAISTVNAWRNLVHPSDVDNSGESTAGDALRVINELRNRLYSREDGGTDPPEDYSVWPGLYFDVSGDDRVTALDALQVINRLGANSVGDGEMIGGVTTAVILPVLFTTYANPVEPGATKLDPLPAILGETASQIVGSNVDLATRGSGVTAVSPGRGLVNLLGEESHHRGWWQPGTTERVWIGDAFLAEEPLLGSFWDQVWGRLGNGSRSRDAVIDRVFDGWE